METTETFKKIYIKSEADLPKPGKYNVHYKQVGDDSLWLRDYNEEFKTHWLDHIDWYLSPVKQLGKDEIIDLCKKVEDYIINDNSYDDCIVSSHPANRFDKLVSSLSMQGEVVGLSDEDIEKWAEHEIKMPKGKIEQQFITVLAFIESVIICYRAGLREGAKAMQNNKIKPNK